LGPQELTRRAMYDLVWSNPMTKVAEEFGISDVALKKICAKHSIPTPPRGYWARKEAGQRVKQTPFREEAGVQKDRIFVRRRMAQLPDEVRKVVAEERQRRNARPKTPDPSRERILGLVDIHSAVSATAKMLRKATPDSAGVVTVNGEGVCSLNLGGDSVERAIRVLDGLARLLEQRGLQLKASRAGLSAIAGADSVTVSLVEKTEIRKYVPSEEELAAEERRLKKRERDARRGLWEFSERSYQEFDTLRTGALSLELPNHYFGLRRSWSDGKIQRLEGVLDDATGGVVAYLAAIKARREENEQREKEWRRNERLRTVALARAEREGKRREFVDHFVNLSTEAGNLAAFRQTMNSLRRDRHDDDLTRMMQWIDRRLAALQKEMAPEGINSSLQARKLFPAIDELDLNVDD
jgi:hypothetical protein